MMSSWWTRWYHAVGLVKERTCAICEGLHTRNHVCMNLRTSDVVLVDEAVPRGLWPLGLVKEALKGKDGRVPL